MGEVERRWHRESLEFGEGSAEESAVLRRVQC